MTKTYYDIRDDLTTFPDAWCYLVWSKRGPGKTYSTLRYMVEENKKFVFLKRTIEDVKLLCSDGSGRGVEFDISPFVPLNRDFGWDIKPVPIIKGIAGFYHAPDGQPSGDPVGYCVALSASKDIKGFDMSDADVIVFDEFIPKPWERVNRKEGDQLLDLYKTLDRDRIHRGLKPTKLVCLANATEINNPVFSVLEVVDIVAQLDNQESFTYYDRGIFIRKVNNPDFREEEEKHPMIAALKDTQWGQMALNGSFAYNDFSLVKSMSLKGAQPFCSIIYKKKHYYIYHKNGKYFATTSAYNIDKPIYNLDKESEIPRYWMEVGFMLRLEAVEGNVFFKTYTLYDVIFNFKKIFKM